MSFRYRLNRSARVRELRNFLPLSTANRRSYASSETNHTSSSLPVIFIFMNDDALACLYPKLTPAELTTARENLERYLSLVAQIHEHVQRDASARKNLYTLTDRLPNPTLAAERSKTITRTLKIHGP